MYADRFPEYRDAGFYRPVLEWQVSSLGIGTYLGAMDEAGDKAYTDALIAAGENGINFFDCAINYRQQRSERNIGFLTSGAVPRFVRPQDVVGGMHSMAPDFLADQIDRSRANLGVDTIDIFYLHNPETQLGFVSEEFDSRVRAVFVRLEELVAQGKIRYYGAATWEGFIKKGARALSLAPLAEIATEFGGARHHFRFIQLPFNLGMVEAFVDRPESLESPGISVALVGMSRREHVLENLGVARVAPIPREQYLKTFQ